MSKPDQKKRPRRTPSSSSDDDLLNTKKIYADGYDDNYRGDAKDRAWLKTLSEREREAEILKRYEQRETLKHREEISKKLKSKTKDNNETKTTTFDSNIYADDDDDDDGYPSSTNRRKQVNESKQQNTQRSQVLKMLMEERKKKQDEKVKKSLTTLDDEKSSKQRHTEKLHVSDVYTSGSSDDEDDHRKRSRSPDVKNKNSVRKETKHTPITKKSQLKPIVLSRFRMEKWCHAPFFNNAVKGAFARVNIGQNNGITVYRVCEIIGAVETSKIYNLGATRTNKGLRLKHGRNERMFRLEFVSNSEITDTEFLRWRETLTKYKIPLPTLEQIQEKKEKIDRFKQYVFSDCEISKIVEEKQRFRKTPINYAMAKQELMKEIEIAKDDNDKRRENELTQKLNQIEARASEIDRIRTANNSALADINRRNRKNTQKNVEHALSRLAQEQQNATADAFTRRRCAPTLVSKAEISKEELIRKLHLERAAEEDRIAKKKLAEQRLIEEKNKSDKLVITTNGNLLSHETILPAITTKERGSFTTLTEKNDELFLSHDFELDFAIKIPD